MIIADKISKKYGKTQALEDFSYEFNSGIYAILGPNGSGKSTLMNIITGNLSPDSGKVYFSNNRSSGCISRIGYVPQDIAMYPYFTVFEILDYFAVLNKVENRETIINELLQTFDLESSCQKKVKSLSGGTKQRLAIAQSFISDPQYMVFDEPTAGLDPLQRISFKNAIQKKSNNTVIIISTHIVSDVEDIANQVLFLKNGCLVKAGTIDSITRDLDGMCWTVCNNNPFSGLSRIVGDELRIISSTQPSIDAVNTRATLEDYYLYLYGQEQHQ